MQITWQSQEAMSLCLYQKRYKNPLACWQKAKTGQHMMALDTQKSLAFLLKATQQDTVLASETFEVVHDQKQFRRARRNAWAFF